MAEPDAHATGGVRRRRSVALAALVALVGAAAALTGAGFADGQIQTQPLDAQRAHIRELEAGLIEIDGRADGASRAYEAADLRVAQLQSRIAGNNRALVRSRREFRRAQERLAIRLVHIYRNEPPSPIEVLASSGSLTDAMDSIELLKQVERHDRRILEDTHALKGRLAALRASLAEDHREALRARREAGARMEELRTLAGQRRRLLANARATLMNLEAAESRRRQAAAAAATRARVAAVGRAERRAGAAADGSASPVVAPAAGPQPSADTTPGTAPAPAAGGVSSHLQQIARCESGGNPRAVSPGGTYRGKYQFHPATWRAVGGTGDPAAAPEAEQDMRAAILYSRTGPSSWPVCGAR